MIVPTFYHFATPLYIDDLYIFFCNSSHLKKLSKISREISRFDDMHMHKSLNALSVIILIVCGAKV